MATQPGNGNRPVRKPPWLKIRLQTDEAYRDVRTAVGRGELHTVCEEAKCPNLHECWNAGTATFMILGDTCTRACAFCAVTSGKPKLPDPGEPERVAAAVARLGIRFAVVTSVDRDDLPDYGSAIFAATVEAIRRRNPQCEVEVLIPDFQGSEKALTRVIDAGPLVIGHNVEVVSRLYPEVRFNVKYENALDVLRTIARLRRSGQLVKTALMTGIGEEDHEVEELLRDVRDAGCDVINIGQYLRPTRNHRKVYRYVHPDQFARWKEFALSLGFVHVESGPLVRSSYHSERVLEAGRQLARRERDDLREAPPTG